MGIQAPGLCIFCGKPDDGTDAEIVAIPKAWGHLREYNEAQAEDIWKMSDRVPCCQARIVMQGFGGCLVIDDDKIPQDEFWRADKINRRLRRFKVDPTNNTVTELPPMRPSNPPPAAPAAPQTVGEPL